MKSRLPWVVAVLVLVAALLIYLCRSKPAPPVAAAPTPIPAAPTVAPPPTPTPDVLASSLDEINKRGYLKDAFFDFNRSEITGSQQASLDANAKWLQEHPSVRVRVEGHCDQRGTPAYNKKLGDRRATAVREYLSKQGVDKARVETVSHGKERPFSQGSDETAWAQNRRGHFVVTAK
jgi:peptidoglycan-associated lipoprotein